MKQTIFQFWIRFGEHPTEGRLDEVANMLKDSCNIDDVETDLEQKLGRLLIRVNFPDSDSAKRLHKKIMTALMKTDGVSIAQVKTNLSEVFG